MSHWTFIISAPHLLDSNYRGKEFPFQEISFFYFPSIFSSDKWIKKAKTCCEWKENIWRFFFGLIKTLLKKDFVLQSVFSEQVVHFNPPLGTSMYYIHWCLKGDNFTHKLRNDLLIDFMECLTTLSEWDASFGE